MYTKWQEGREKRGRETRGQERNRNKKKDERKGGRKAVIRSRKCLNCKWVNVTPTAEQPDGHMMELSSLTVLCHCPVKQREWDIFCHFTSNFLGIGGHKISEKAEGNTPTPESFSLCLYHTHNYSEETNFSCLWGSSPQPCRQMRFDTCDSTVNPG